MIKRFKLGAKNYRVIRKRGDQRNLGMARSPLCQIEVSTEWDGKPVPEESQEQTVIHEVVHCILDEIAQLELSQDEHFVQSFAVLMHQFIKTAK